MDIIKRIKEKRVDLGWSILTLAKETGLSYRSIKNFEDNLHSPTLATINRICEALELELVIQDK